MPQEKPEPVDKVRRVKKILIKEGPEKISGPKKKKKSSFSKKLPAVIEIGSVSLRLLQLADTSDSKLKVVCVDQEAYPQKGKEQDLQLEALKKIVARNKVGRQAVTIIPASDTQIYNLVFPQMADDELTEALHWKLTQLKPFGLDVDAVVYDYLRLDSFSRSKARQQTIVAACISRKKILDKIALFRCAGIKLTAIESAPFALVNLNALRPRSSQEVVIWLEFGSFESSLIIAKGGALYFYKSLSLTVTNMDSQIAQRCRINKDEAAVARKQYGLNFWAADKKITPLGSKEQFSNSQIDKSVFIYQSMVSSLESLIVDIEHSFKYFSYQMTQSQINKFDRIIISGSGSELNNLDNFLGNRLRAPVDKIDPFSLFEDQPVQGSQDVLESRSEFSVLAGAAVTEGFKKRFADKKLYPKGGPKLLKFILKLPKKGLALLFDNLRKSPLKLVFLFLILVGVSAGTQFSKSTAYKKELKTLTEQIARKKSQLSRQHSKQIGLAQQEGGLEEKALELKARLSTLRSAIRTPEEFSDIFAQIANLLAEEIWVTKLSYAENTVTMEGSTSDMKIVMKLIESLKAAGSFSDATFRYTQKDPDEDIYSFEILAILK